MSDSTPSKAPRRWWAVMLGLTLAWGLFLAFFGPRERSGDLLPPGLIPPSLPERADYAWELEDLDGNPVDFGRYKGRPVFLNIWNTGCPPCLDELPAINQLAANPRLRGVAFVGVSTDEYPETLRQFVAARKPRPTILRARSLSGVFATQGLPATFLIAPDGTIIASQEGAAQWDDPAVVDLLESLARRQPAPSSR